MREREFLIFPHDVALRHVLVLYNPPYDVVSTGFSAAKGTAKIFSRGSRNRARRAQGIKKMPPATRGLAFTD
jgi:hypothetical protein